MTEIDEDDVKSSSSLLPREAFTRTTEHYVFSVLGYLAIGIVTKTLLTFTMALLYFVLTLDLLPRGYTWLRHLSRLNRSDTR
jgi:hypothetical protein